MKWLLASTTLLLVVAAASPAAAKELIEWTEVTPLSGTVVGDQVEVVGPGTFPLTVIEDPVVEDAYAVVGTVRYSGVEGDSYLEMWSHFADGGAFFSRTLGESGPIASLTGTSASREFELPFLLNGADGPTRLEINIVLVGEGTAAVGPLALIADTNAGSWFDDRSGGIIGGVAGSVAGLLGAALGIVGGRRKARRTVLTGLKVLATIGVASLVIGIYAALQSQPSHVWSLFVLLGVLLTFVCGGLIPTMNRAYENAELQRMKALDT